MKRRHVFAGAVLLGTLFFNTTTSTHAVGATTARVTSASVDDRAILDRFSLAFEESAQRVDPAVVAILSEAETPVSYGLEGVLPRFFGFRPEQTEPEGKMLRRGLGSGVIVRSDGYILTNNHVVDGATRLKVRLNDDRELPATVVGTDPQSDLAVIRVEADGLPVATFGNSDDLRVGTWVIAVGNPLEMYHTVTAGIVSATGRSSVGLSVYENFIQTDASINPGNSGGALADLDGRVIGINTAIASPTGTNVGIGFAIPINRAQRVMEELIASGHVTRGYLALIPQDVDSGLATALHLESTHGALVAGVTPDGPADRAGLRAGDVILAIDGKTVNDSAALRDRVAEERPGSDVPVRFLRDGREKTVHVKLDRRPDPEEVASKGRGEGSDETTSRGKLGLGIESLTPELAERLEVGNLDGGVVVSQVVPGSPADRAGLRRGDVIDDVNTDHVTSADDFAARVRKAKAGETLALRVHRGALAFYAPVEIPST